MNVATEAGDRLLAVYSPDARPADREELTKAAAPQRRGLLSRPARGPARSSSRGALARGGATRPARCPPGSGGSSTTPRAASTTSTACPSGASASPWWPTAFPSSACSVSPSPSCTYTALRGHGAYQSGLRAHGVGEVRPRRRHRRHRPGRSRPGARPTPASAGRSRPCSSKAFLVRATVPSTFPLLLVAGGHIDAFWQYQPVLPGIALGILLATEAGGVVTAIDGSPWTPRVRHGAGGRPWCARRDGPGPRPR